MYDKMAFTYCYKSDKIMDNGRGFFEEIDNEKFNEQMKQENPLVFRVGEIIEVRGSRLRVEKIYKKKITFKLLPSRE